jgi:hypothetical protein
MSISAFVVLSEAKDLIAACYGMRSFASLRMTDRDGSRFR